MTSGSKQINLDAYEVHTKALDDIVNVNSLFTIAVFLGISIASRSQQALEGRIECNPDPDMAKRLILYEVASFACFLFSSLIAKSLKVYLNIFRSLEFKKRRRIFQWGRGTMFLFSVLSSIVGVILLTLSMIDVIQIKVGKLSCGSNHALAAVISLIVLVLLALAIYLPTMVFAILFCATY